MKKTLMVLCFALCASFAFAQTNRVVGRITKGNDMQRVARQAVTEQLINGTSVDYKGSIFTKEDTLALFDFSMPENDANANYSFGDIVEGDLIDGAQAPIDAQEDLGSTWMRWPTTDSATLAGLGFANYSQQLSGYFLNPNSSFSVAFRMDPEYCSSDNGFAMLDAYDAVGNSGLIDSYIKFAPVSTSGVDKIAMRVFQYYVRFGDKCYVDYSTDGGNTWSTQQVNSTVQNGISAGSWGYVKFNLPAAAAAADNVILRLRWYLTGNASGYGYWWFIDDIAVVEVPEYQFTREKVLWTEGGYQQMPQGLSTPFTGAFNINNTGASAQSNVTVDFDHIYNNEVETLHSFSLGTIASEVDSTYKLTYSAGLPTNNVGDNYITSTLRSAELGEEDAYLYDTILFNVNTPAADGSMTWGHDNGLLNAAHSFLFGYDTSYFINDEGEPQHYVADESPYYSAAGTMVCVAMTTGDNIPVDNQGRPWVIRGIEYVVAIDENVINSEVGANIQPIVFRDSVDEDDYVNFIDVNNGISSYVTKPATEYNDPMLAHDFGCFTPDDGYNTVRIAFPIQGELKPATRYHVGYQLNEDAKFAVAQSSKNYFTTWDEESGRYSVTSLLQDPTKRKYAHNFTFGNTRLANYLDVLVYQRIDGYTGAGFNVGTYPMIRLLVGPRSETKPITINCEFQEDDEDLGGVYDVNYDGICGSTMDVVTGGSTSIYVIPADEFTEFTLTVDGNVVDVNGLETQTVYSSDGELTAYKYDFNNVTEAHVVNANFQLSGIDDIASAVKLNLQPNPATSKVKLNIQGVSGMVDCALLDMSGRVVTSRRINAEVENEISVSNLAKGAYFVRITNSDFTKVERLIVR